MIRIFILILMLACLPIVAHAIDPIEFQSPAEEARFQSMAKQLRCLVCQNESLADSNAGLAQDLRHQVIEQMRSGKSDTDIKQYLTARYGDFILYNPPLKHSTWLLWLGPALLLMVGLMVATIVIRKRKPSGHALPSHDPTSGEW